MKFSPLSDQELNQKVVSIEVEIQKCAASRFEKNPKWKHKFPQRAGIYFGFLDNKLCYIGETAELRARMGDLGNTYNHTLRKKIGILKLGFKLEKNEKTGKLSNKFKDGEEVKLNKYMSDHLEIKFLDLNFGRKEVEDQLVEKYKNDLLNSVSLRGKKKN